MIDEDNSVVPSFKKLRLIGQDQNRPLRNGLYPKNKIVTSVPGSVHRFETPGQVAPISSYDMQIRLANEFRKGSCDPMDPPPRSEIPLDPALFSGYTGLGEPEDITDEEDFEFRCLISNGRMLGVQPGNPRDPDSDTDCDAGSCNPYRSAGCHDQDGATDQHSDQHGDGEPPGSADDQLDCRGAVDLGSIDNPISGGLWFDDMVTDPSC